MTYNPELHHRCSIRLRGFDYAATGAYFVTICVQGRECLFGEVVDGTMHLNDAGRMVVGWWSRLPEKFPHVTVDAYAIMPNHFHGIVSIVGADPCVRPDFTDPCVRPDGSDDIHSGAHAGAPLHRVVQWFKTMTTNAYINGVKIADWPTFPGRLWQRNYYERIVRDEAELSAIRDYIANNPLQWPHDADGPTCPPDFTGYDHGP